MTVTPVLVYVSVITPLFPGDNFFTMDYRGELHATNTRLPDGSPDWEDAGMCDPRGLTDEEWQVCADVAKWFDAQPESLKANRPRFE